MCECVSVLEELREECVRGVERREYGKEVYRVERCVCVRYECVSV